MRRASAASLSRPVAVSCATTAARSAAERFWLSLNLPSSLVDADLDADDARQPAHVVVGNPRRRATALELRGERLDVAARVLGDRRRRAPRRARARRRSSKSARRARRTRSARHSRAARRRSRALAAQHRAAATADSRAPRGSAARARRDRPGTADGSANGRPSTTVSSVPNACSSMKSQSVRFVVFARNASGCTCLELFPRGGRS